MIRPLVVVPLAAALLTARLCCQTTGAAPKPSAFDFATSWREVASGFRSDCEEQRVVGASLAFLRGDELLGACDPQSDAARVLSRESLLEMWEPVLPIGASRTESMGLCFFVSELDGQRFVGHTGEQHGFVTFFYLHPESGTAAVGAFNTGTAGPAMASVRGACMRRLSLPMAVD